MAVYKKGDNYFIDYYLNGRRKRELIGIDRKLAEVVLAKRKVQIAEGRFLDIKKKMPAKLYEIFDDFLEYSRNCKKSYKRDLILTEHLKKFFDNMVLSEVTPGLIEKYRTKRLTGDNVRNSTVNRETAFLKAAFNLAIRNGKSADNPVRFFKKLKEPDGRLRFLSHDEMNMLLNACKKYFRPVVVCALLTGMRRNEILNLEWKDVDMDEGFIRVVNTKNGRVRNIPICGMLHRTLKECAEWSDGVYVFCNSNGGKYHSVHSLWDNTVSEAGIKDFRFHDLRHTAASYLVMSGVDLATVKEILGHRTLEMTLRYSHLSNTHMKNAMETLGTRMDTILTNGMDTKVDTKGKTAIVDNL